MKKNLLFRTLFALTAAFFLCACGDDSTETPTPAPPPPAPAEKPTVTLTAGEASLDALSVNLVSEHAEQVKWMCYTDETPAPDAATILREGTETEPNREVEITVGELPAATTYTFVAVAVAGNEQTLSNRVTMTTLEPEPDPTVALEFLSVTETTVTFRLSSTDAEEVKWIYIEKGSRELKAEQVLQYGTSADANTTVEITAEGLKDDTEYEFHAVAAAGEVLVMAEPFEAKTIKEIRTYAVTSENASVTLYNTTSYTNFYVTFEDKVNNYTFVADIYTAPESSYFPEGEYMLGAAEPGNISKSYTSFTEQGGDPQKFSEGSINVTATLNEKQRTVTYRITGQLTLENGHIVTVAYRGEIEGIILPKPGAPEGYYTFEPDPSKLTPKRITRNDEKPGQYTLRFYNKDSGELTLDILAAPTLCENGNAGLPAGTYSIAAGTMTNYTSISLYSPYWSCNLSSCEVKVSYEEGVYSFVVDAEGTSSGTTKKIWMEYTGEIQEMVRE